MKKIISDAKNFNILRQLDEFAKARGQKIGDAGCESDFIAACAASLASHQKNGNMLHGFRIQSMFAYLAAALGECRIISEEDSGELFVDTTSMRRPDFRILTKDGVELFVEVKNFFQKDPFAPYSFTSEYVESLRNYADAFGRPLLFAVYWARWPLWSLTPVDQLELNAEKYLLPMPGAVENNHLFLLGDRTIGIPKPLALRLFSDPQKPRAVDTENHAEFTIGKAAFFAGDQEIVDPVEQNLAGFCLRYGSWDDIERPAIIEDGKLISFDLMGVKEDRNPEQGFQLIGALSVLLARWFNDLTVEERTIRSLSPNVTSEIFTSPIPKDYRGRVMKLWRFEVRPKRLSEMVARACPGLKLKRAD